MADAPPVTMSTFQTGRLPTWCPGCGDFGIWTSLQQALAGLGVGPDRAAICYGIGCHGNMYDWMNVYGFPGLHGRSIPVAQGIKLANHTLPVIAVCGDGDCLGEGGNHFIHAAKRNPDITVIIHDNQVYGLTTGQAAPTAKQGFKTKSTPEGVVDEPIIPMALALTAGATFIARGFSGDAIGLKDLMMKAIQHKGFSVLDVLQPCVTFDKVHTYGWYRQRLYRLSDTGYTPNNKFAAFEKMHEWGDKIPTGIFYQEERATSEDAEPALKDKILRDLPLEISDWDAALTEFY